MLSPLTKLLQKMWQTIGLNLTKFHCQILKH